MLIWILSAKQNQIYHIRPGSGIIIEISPVGRQSTSNYVTLGALVETFKKSSCRDTVYIGGAPSPRRLTLRRQPAPFVSSLLSAFKDVGAPPPPRDRRTSPYLNGRRAN